MENEYELDLGPGSPSKQPPTLVPLLGVGVSEVPGGIVLLRKDTIVYCVGRLLGLYSSAFATTSPRLSEPQRVVRGISAIGGSSSRVYVAAAETTIEGYPPQVAIFHAATLERVAVLTGPRVTSTYISLSFSGDDTTILAAGFDEETKTTLVHLWEWHKSLEPIATAEYNGVLIKASIDPKFSSNLATMSSTELQVWRRSPNGLKRHTIHDKNKAPGTTYVDHCWKPSGRLVTATSSREIQVIERNEIVHRIRVDRAIVSVEVMPDDSIVAAMQGGFLQLFSRGRGVANANSITGSTEATPAAAASGEYGIIAELQVPENHNSTALAVVVKGLSTEPGGEKVACLVRNGPVYLVNMQYAKTSVYNASASIDMWETLFPSVHEGPIIGASLAVKRELLATASADLTVRVWQYNPLRLVVTHMCHHTPTAVGLDPWGRELVVCYVDSVRCYDVVEGMVLEVLELRCVTEGDAQGGPLERCTRVKYNPTGSMLALVGGPGGKEIYIFSTLHKRQLALLKGHFAAVNDIAWSEDGLYLCSTCDGAVYTWQMDGFVKKEENTIKTFANDALAVSPDFNLITVGDSTQGLRIFGTRRRQIGGQLQTTAGAGGGSGGDDGNDFGRVGTSAGAGDASPTTRPLASQHGSMHTPTTPAFLHSATTARAGLAKTGKVGLSIAARSDHSAGTDLHIADVPELQCRAHYTSVLLPIRSNLAMAWTKDYKVLIGSGVMGRMRLTTLPPTGDRANQELFPHSTDVLCVLAHDNGQLVFTVDNAGVWMMHALVLPQAPSLLRATARALTEATGPRRVGLHDGAHAARTNAAHTTLAALRDGPDGKARRNLEIVSLRALDLGLLKDNVREMKEAMTKAASEADFKVYEKEQAVRREVEAEIARLRAHVAELNAANTSARAAAANAAHQWGTQAATMRSEYQAGLVQQQDDFEAKLAYEITRTDEKEKDGVRLRAKFGRKLEQLDEQAETAAAESVAAIAALNSDMEVVRSAAEQSILKAEEHMELETALDMELNEEEIGRVGEAKSKALAARDAKYNALLAKHVMQTGLTNNTTKENELLVQAAAELKADRDELSAQVESLNEQLRAMHEAWQERDVRQRSADNEMKDLAFQLQQAQLYSTLATTRIQELNGELDPMKAAREEAVSSVARLESVQLRQLERQRKVMSDNTSLTARLDNALKEIKTLRDQGNQREHYFKNFAAQIFQVLHNIPHQQWPVLFGRMVSDYELGKDKVVWSKYIADKNVTPGGRAEDDTQPVTEAEYADKMGEVTQHLLHTERLMGVLTSTKERAEAARRSAVARLQSENVSVMRELNQHKRDLKISRETVEKLTAEISQMRLMLPAGAAAAAAAAAATVSSHVGEFVASRVHSHGQVHLPEGSSSPLSRSGSLQQPAHHIGSKPVSPDNSSHSFFSPPAHHSTEYDGAAFPPASSAHSPVGAAAGTAHTASLPTVLESPASSAGSPIPHVYSHPPHASTVSAPQLDLQPPQPLQYASPAAIKTHAAKPPSRLGDRNRGASQMSPRGGATAGISSGDPSTWAFQGTNSGALPLDSIQQQSNNTLNHPQERGSSSSSYGHSAGYTNGQEAGSTGVAWGLQRASSVAAPTSPGAPTSPAAAGAGSGSNAARERRRGSGSGGGSSFAPPRLMHSGYGRDGFSGSAGGPSSPSSPSAATPAQVVNGDMPAGGWWLGDGSKFEVASSLSMHRGNGESNGQTRPTTSDPTAMRRPATTANTTRGAPMHQLQQQQAVDSQPLWPQQSSASNSINGSPDRRSTFTPPTPHGNAHSPPNLRLFAASQASSQTAAAVAASAAAVGIAGMPSSPNAGAAASGVASGPLFVPASPSSPGRVGRRGSGSSIMDIPSGAEMHEAWDAPDTSIVGHAGNWSSGGGGGTVGMVRSNVGGVPALPLHHLHASGGRSGMSNRSGAAAAAATIAALSGQVRPITPSRVTTMGAGFRSFQPRGGGSMGQANVAVGGGSGSPVRGGLTARGSSR